jgi:hypothetical protein
LLFDLPWDGDYRRVGARLLTESLEALRRGGATVADLGMDCLKEFAPPAARCVGELLTAGGWEVTRETLRFDLRLDDGQQRAVGCMDARARLQRVIWGSRVWDDSSTP